MLVAWQFPRICPHWSSNKPPVMASDRCLYCLPIILLAPSTKTESEGDCIYRKGERERSKGTERESYRSIERRFFSPVAQGRFHWKAVAVYRSALRDGYCEAKDGEWVREREKGGGIHAARETQRQNGIQLCCWRIREERQNSEEQKERDIAHTKCGARWCSLWRFFFSLLVNHFSSHELCL